LYGRDHRALRHPTLHEVPRLLVWSAGGTLATDGLLRATAHDSVALVGGLTLWITAVVTALLLRNLARTVWLWQTPTKQELMVGNRAVAAANAWDIPSATLRLKRALDVAVSLTLLVLLAPLFALIALAIRLDSRGNPLFAQWRAGLRGRPFRMYKFRTMVWDAEKRLSELLSIEDLREPMFKMPQDPRVTPVGHFLRRTSLDELPQLLNVLKGEMSLVGPRPEQVELVNRYRPEHLFRLDLKPGMTGPMQVSGRGWLSFDERLALEREYIENVSLARDLRILTLTVFAVVDGKGAF
jgi:lipopolysaccharide/colanic/teichoic acid biosynthesis glycosyltransferase